MSDPLLAAILALCGALVATFITNFLAEDYRRFRDAKSLARALAGELSSRIEAVDLLIATLTSIIESLGRNQKVKLIKIEKIVGRVFENNISKLGLLDKNIIEDVVYVYENITAFRSLMSVASERESDDPQIPAMLTSCLMSLNRAKERSQNLIPQLRSYSEKSYCWFANR